MKIYYIKTRRNKHLVTASVNTAASWALDGHYVYTLNTTPGWERFLVYMLGLCTGTLLGFGLAVYALAAGG